MIVRRRTGGFTLLEVIVALGVVLVLMAVLVPSLRTLQASARSTECSANLRQMFVAAQAYATVYRDTLPAAIVYRMRVDGLATIAWDYEHRSDGSVRPGPMWSFTDTPERTMQCPSFEGASTFGNDPATGYNYNTTYLGAEGRFPDLAPDGSWIDGWSNARLGLPSSSHRRPSDTAVFGDAGWKGGANKFMRAPSNTVENDLGMIYAGGQSFRHTGCANVAYLDGHVQPCTTCHEGPHATPALLESIMGWPLNGFLAEDDTPYDPR